MEIRMLNKVIRKQSGSVRRELKIITRGIVFTFILLIILLKFGVHWVAVQLMTSMRNSIILVEELLHQT